MLCTCLAAIRHVGERFRDLLARMRVLRIDLSGHGGSLSLRVIHADELASDIADMIEALAVNALLVGISVGGMIGAAWSFRERPFAMRGRR